MISFWYFQKKNMILILSAAHAGSVFKSFSDFFPKNYDL